MSSPGPDDAKATLLIVVTLLTVAALMLVIGAYFAR